MLGVFDYVNYWMYVVVGSGLKVYMNFTSTAVQHSSSPVITYLVQIN